MLEFTKEGHKLVHSNVVMVADTPLWDAEQDQIVDLLDFLEAHKEELNMVSPWTQWFLKATTT